MTQSQPLEKPANPGELIAYQDDSIVSRTFIKHPSGSVTLFAFDKGQGLSEHTTAFDALVHVIDGRARITVGGREHEVSAGELIPLPANVPHAVHAAERFKMLLVMIWPAPAPGNDD